ncbi:MAG: hypothetical protein ACW9W3_01875 [Candidatus Nitrosopumilus sp. bin_68KS]
MIDYKKNIRKRIIYIIIGIAVSYVSIIPLTLIFSLLQFRELPDPITSYFFYNGIRIGIVILFFYFAFIVVKPSLVPQLGKYKRLIMFTILLIVTLTILFPSGYLIPQLEQGACITKSGSYNEEGHFSGSSSQGMSNESDCVESCIFSGKLNTRGEKLCEFKGMFGKTHWVKTPDEFDKSVLGEIIK